MTNDLTALRDALVKATGPDRELDLALGKHLLNGETWMRADAWGSKIYLRTVDDNTTALLAYTGSVDAAVTLVPEGMVWLRKSQETMTIVLPSEHHDGWGKHFDATAATPALALCLARVTLEIEKQNADAKAS